jgi:hypothetical protein
MFRVLDVLCSTPDMLKRITREYTVSKDFVRDIIWKLTSPKVCIGVTFAVAAYSFFTVI